MSTIKPTISLASKDDIGAIVECASAALAGNQLFSYLLGKGKLYEKRSKSLFGFMTRNALRNGTVWHLGNPSQAFIFTVPDSAGLYRLRNQIKVGGLGLVASCGPAAVLRSIRFEDLALKVREKYVSDVGPHLYVYLIAVHPEHQRKGLAAILIEHAAAIAKSQGRTLILETMTDENKHYYEKNGFAPVCDLYFPAGGLTYTGMVRR